MRKIIPIVIVVLMGPTLCSPSALAQTGKTPEREPDSEYVEKESDQERDEEGGLFDFLPFVDSRKKKVDPEKLEPSPPPEESRPVLFKNELEQLRVAAEKWVRTTEYAEPAVRQEGAGKYYRDYIVFADEYEAKVIRGRTEEVPFIGHIYIKGDYFRTESHDTSEEAGSDFKFKYQTREFRAIFNRVEKWEYSDSPTAEPFVFVERWVLAGRHSRPTVDFSGGALTPEPPVEENEETPPQPAED